MPRQDVLCSLFARVFRTVTKNVYSNTVCVSGACVNVLIKTYKPTSKIETNNSLRTSVKWSEIHHSHVLESFNVKNKVINWLEDHFEFH